MNRSPKIFTDTGVAAPSHQEHDNTNKSKKLGNLVNIWTGLQRGSALESDRRKTVSKNILAEKKSRQQKSTSKRIVGTYRSDDAEVDAEIAVDAGAADADEDAQVDAGPPRSLW